MKYQLLRIITWFFTVPFLLLYTPVYSNYAALAQASGSDTIPDTLRYTLAEIEIQAARETETEVTAPFSVSVAGRTIQEQGSEQALSFDRIASGIPGLWVNDRQNYALGERVSIRGMGWRTAFGVRGIYVLLDDIPLTVPDGQTVMDILDPAMVRQIEVIRGPSSSFWGNAGGGALILSTRPASFDTSLRIRTMGGSFGTYSAQVQGSHQKEARAYHLNASWLSRDGYRDHSQHQVLRLTGHMQWQLGPGRELRFSSAFVDAPDTRHPGSLNEADLATDRRQAASLFKNASAGKSWRQGQAGVTLRSENEAGLWQATLYGVARSLHNPLPFADIEVDRLMGGMRLSLTNSWRSLRWSAGTDGAIQSDDRRNYRYTGNFVRGDLAIDQQETVLNGALFTRISSNFDRINISGGIRLDAIRFESDDRLQRDGEDRSGRRMFTALSPSIGVSWKINPGLIFLNYGTSFETPTTTELVNRPDMTGGFNPDIRPERTAGYEAGFRGGWPPVRLRYDVAIFRMVVRDQLISYRTEEGGDRNFYRNAGKTRHDGMELSLRWFPALWMEISGNYNLSRFVFREPFSSAPGDFDATGNRLPGIPKHRLASSLSITPRDFRFSLSAEALDSYYVNNENTSKNPGFSVLHMTLGHDGINLSESILISPFITVNNITNARYNSSVSINANFGRYYEPAPGRAIYAGFSLAL